MKIIIINFFPTKNNYYYCDRCVYIYIYSIASPPLQNPNRTHFPPGSNSSLCGDSVEMVSTRRSGSLPSSTSNNNKRSLSSSDDKSPSPKRHKSLPVNKVFCSIATAPFIISLEKSNCFIFFSV